MPNPNQIDLLPSTPGNTTGLSVHAPAGNTASVYNANSDFPAPPKSGVAVVTKINGTQGSQVRFANPS